MSRFSQLRDYARRIQESIQRLGTAISETLRNIGRFLRNLLLIFTTTIQRGLEILRIHIIDLIKVLIRAIIDTIKIPIERVILPISRFLANKTEELLTLIRTRDEIALILFLIMLLSCCLCGFLALRSGR
jgi:hypothetical protein